MSTREKLWGLRVAYEVETNIGSEGLLKKKLEEFLRCDPWEQKRAEVLVERYKVAVAKNDREQIDLLLREIKEGA